MKYQQHGFTLIEAMITIAILAIVLNMGVTSFQDYFKREYVNASTELIAQSLRFARAHAISSNQQITSCLSNDKINCDKYANQYFMVFNDKNQNLDVDVGELLEIGQIQTKTPLISFRMSAGRHYVRHNPNGTVREFGHITICSDDGDVYRAKNLTVSRMGRVRNAKDTDGDGVVNVFNGENVSC